MIDGLTEASAFGSIIGLITNFKGERRAKEDEEYKVFLQWLEETRQNSILEEINENRDLAKSIQNLLEQNHDTLLEKLDQINSAVFKIASSVNDFKDLAKAISNNAGISDQAMSILAQLLDSEGSFFVESKMIGGTLLHILDGKGGMVQIDEPRFVESDLQFLTELGLLILDYTTKGSRKWTLTREAVGLVEANRTQA